MKKLYSIVLLLTGVVALAQTGNDPNAKKILDDVSSKFKTYKTVEANFTYKAENADGKAVSTKKGTVFMKGTKYKVNFAGQEIFSDGSTVWTYDKSSNEVTITKLDDASKTVTPQKLFTNFYDKDFLYKLNGEKKDGGKVLQEIEMTPNDKTKTFHKVYLLIDKTAKTLYSTKVLEKGGNRYTYTVTKLKANGAMPDNKFIWNEKDHPGVEVVDLR
jgi:outer membrane lipoprotein carrier protein